MKQMFIRAIAGTLALASVGLVAVEADAMPIQSLSPSMPAASNIEKTYLVCGRYGCVRRGYYYRRPFYGYRRRYWRRW